MRLLTVFLFKSLILTALLSCSNNRQANRYTGTTTNERIKFNDPKTGNEVWQITNDNSVNNVPYFYLQAFTADDAWVIFKSDRGDGKWRIHRSNMETGEISRVSDRVIRSFYSIMPDGKRVAFMSGNALYAVNVATLEEEKIYSFEPTEEEVARFSAFFSADGRYTLLSFFNEAADITRLFRVNFVEKTSELALIFPGRVTHMLINPRHPHLFVFAHRPRIDMQLNFDLTLDERARYRLFDMNTGTHIPLVMTEAPLRGSHGSWGADGERFYFYRKYRGRPRSVTIVSVDRRGEDLREYYHSAALRLGHGTADPTQRWFITDSQDRYENPLIKIDLITGESVVLCWPNSSNAPPIRGRCDHVHPVISASGRFVAFTSDNKSRGIPQMFVVPIP